MDDDASMDALWQCRKNILFVPLLEGRTLFKEVVGKWNQTRVHMKPGPREGGQTACGMIRCIFDCIGVEDFSARILGRKNPFTVLYAIFDGLKQQTSFRQIALDRGVNFYDLLDKDACPPHPTTSEMAEMEEKAVKAFSEANEVWGAKFRRQQQKRVIFDMDDKNRLLEALGQIDPPSEESSSSEEHEDEAGPYGDADSIYERRNGSPPQ